MRPSVSTEWISFSKDHGVRKSPGWDKVIAHYEREEQRKREIRAYQRVLDYEQRFIDVRSSPT